MSRLRKEFSYAKLIKISSLVYCALTVLFFLLLNVAAGFVAQVQETGAAFSGGAAGLYPGGQYFDLRGAVWLFCNNVDAVFVFF